MYGGYTGAGVIEFYADDDTVMAEALLKLEFDRADLNLGGVYAHSIFIADNVTISGVGIPALKMEGFSFSFASQEPLSGSWDDGFTATASFTSSAIPEPISLGLLTLGSLVLFGVRRRPVARR